MHGGGEGLASWVVDPVTQVELEVPAHGTADEAIWRAARKRMGLFRTVQFYPDHCRDYPLWENDADNCTPDASDLGLSAELAQALQQWQALWNTGRHYASGWSSDQQRREWEHDGDLLCERLREELWLVAEVDDRRTPEAAPE